MSLEAATTQTMLERLEKLERQNRRLKQIGAAALIALSSLILVAQTTTHKTIEANAFVLVDENGSHRAEMSMAGGIPGLTIYGTGKGNVWLGAGEDGAFVSLQGVGGGMPKTLATLRAEGRGAYLSLIGEDGGPSGRASIDLRKAGPSLSLETQSGNLGASSSLNPDALVIQDEEGFHSVLGVASTVGTRTGEKHQTSAAALTMFDKEGRVIWRAPQP